MAHKGYFVWGWGRMTQDDRPSYLILSYPRLLESINCKSLSLLCTGFSRSCVLSFQGELFSFSPIQLLSQDEKIDRETYFEEDKFKQVRLQDFTPIKSVSCNRTCVFGVSAKGVLFRWGDLVVKDAPKQRTKSNEVVTPMRPKLSVSSNRSNRSESTRSNSKKGETPSWYTYSPSIVPMPNNVRIVVVSCGPNFTVASSDDGCLYTWGSNAHGQLGLGHTQSVLNPEPVKSLQQINEAITHVATGYRHVLAISASGKLFSWGCGAKGQLGIGSQKDSSVPILVDFPPESSDDSTSFSESSPEHSRPGTPYRSMLPADISCGFEHSLLADCGGRMWVWGSNSRGQLGLKVANSKDILKPMIIENLEMVTCISAGAFHSGCITKNSCVYMWGANQFGQLGVGDCLDRSDPTLVTSMESMGTLQIACGGDHTIAVTTTFLSMHDDYFVKDITESVLQDRHTPTFSFESPEFIKPGSTAVVFDENPESGLQNKAYRHRETSIDDSFIYNSQVLDVSESLYDVSQVRSSPVLLVNDSNYSVKSKTDISNDSKFAVAGSFLVHPKTPNSADVANSVETTCTTPFTLSATVTAFTSSFSTHSKSGDHIMVTETMLHSPSVSVASRGVEKNRSRSVSPIAGTVTSFFTDLFGLSPSRTVSPSPSLNHRYRPPNLPAKDAAEAEKHEAEVRALYSDFQLKLEKDARDRAAKKKQLQSIQETELEEKKHAAKKQLERERRLDDAYSQWKKMIPKFESMKSSKVVKDLLYEVGIPPKLRGEIWSIAIDNRLSITRELYEVFYNRALAARLNQSSSLVSKLDLSSPSHVSFGKEKTMENIEVDLNRTFPSLAFFNEEGPMNEQLRCLLETYCFYRPDIGYVQGMSFLAGHLLLYMDPFPAFVCFANILNTPFMLAFAKVDSEKMNERYFLFNSLLESTLPNISNLFRNENIIPDMYLMELCCKRLQLDVVSRIWDCYLIYGEFFIYRVAVAILKVLALKLEGQHFGEILNVLKNATALIREEELFKAISQVRVSDKLKESIEKLNRK